VSAPKIALFDIETAPSLGWVWQLRETDVIDVQSAWYILSFAYKWLGEDKIRTVALPDFPRYRRDREDDSKLVKQLWSIFDEADILIAHNGDGFDIKKANARFLFHGLNPPTPYKSIDTLKVARRHFRFDSNRLNDLGKFLGVGKKLPHTGFHLWKGCMSGDLAAWKTMRRYNARDVELLERVYLKLRPWFANHPDLNLYTEGDGCPTCQSENMERRGVYTSKTRKYQRWVCDDCGSWTKGDLIKA
jgi:hypothetical protein